MTNENMQAADHAARCPRCGGEVPAQKSVGRRRVWCSESCRKAGWAQRGSAGAAEEQVADSPEATERLLLLLGERAARGELRGERWGYVRAAAAALGMAGDKT